MIAVCLSMIVVSVALSVPLTEFLIRAARRLGQVDQPGSAGHKQHQQSVPTSGGIAIFLAVSVPLIAMLIAVWGRPPDGWSGWLAAMGPHVDGLRRQTPMLLAVLSGMTVLHVLGLIDDRRNLGPFVKLGIQLIVAAALVGLFELRVLQLLDQFGPLGWTASVVLSILWILTITNAMNLLDNMDGLAGGVGAIIAALYLAATLINSQWFVASLAALLLGALIGFLAFNFPPARVYMGDAGSLVVGLLLAVLSIRTTYVYMDPGLATAIPTDTGGSHAPWYGLLMPLIVMAVPLYDLTSVTLIRMMQGRSPFVGDQQHFSHRLVDRGMSRRTAVIVIWLCTVATGLGGVILARVEGWQVALIGGQTAAVIAVLVLLERAR